MPRGNAPEDEVYNQAEEVRQATAQFEILNEAQLFAFNIIMIAVDNVDANCKLFYILMVPVARGKHFSTRH